ncbi:MAG: GNAT family N-acetyltransferase [Magnetospirillum sp.]|nr:GNAT family N-acetyltransferase [Magnetospirillum sp.]
MIARPWRGVGGYGWGGSENRVRRRSRASSGGGRRRPCPPGPRRGRPAGDGRARPPAAESRNPGLILAERDGRVVGMAVVPLGQHVFSPALAATVQLLYVAPEARGGPAAVKLLRALPKWADPGGRHRPPPQRHHRHRPGQDRPLPQADGVPPDRGELRAGGGGG